MTGKLLRIRLLTEDSAESATNVLQHLVKQMLYLLEPNAILLPDRVEFQPIKDEDGKRAMRGNRWKENRGRSHEAIVLKRRIATDLMLAGGFVFFHYDGDCAWKDQKTCRNAREFKKFIREGVRLILRGSLAEKQLDASDPALDERLARLFEVVPFYSVEAWLFQSRRIAITLCKEQHNGDHVEWHEAWKEKPAELDDFVQPKLACKMKTDSYTLLAETFPRDEVYALNASFAATTDRLLQSDELLTILRATRDMGWSGNG